MGEGKIAQLEKVNNVWGSSAGSGSDAWPIYRRHRNRELARLDQMDKDYDDMQAAEAFQAKREAAEQADEAATAARRSKRQRKKEAKAEAKATEKTRKEASTLNSFTGDGSFLEQMQKLSAAEIQVVEKEAEALKEAAKAKKAAQVPQITVQQMSSDQNITIRDA